ncbi:MAG TPA: GreA/GreB family elongation factor [Candidatus Paceibacterota bacterium]
MPFYFTPTGRRRLEDLIARLESNVSKIHATGAEACELGGDLWHDNPSYDAMLIDLRGADKRLSDAMRVRNQASVVEVPSNPRTIVIGTLATVVLNSEECKFGIVSYGQSDPDKDFIAYDTPLAQFLYNLKEGEEKEAKMNGRPMKVVVKKIQPLTPQMEE